MESSETVHFFNAKEEFAIYELVKMVIKGRIFSAQNNGIFLPY